ncbi:PQQ-dependent sugar dehydrogenase [Streptomyces sp. CB01881]|uniref:PQQ-dependent sugar dehydrogenase n=1 Tax=Streptomyces sp. CB01881 TaxID=2078691 RepID=UPI000CDC324D|nr:PQQ-dependent sugar dehydrogenase [Streptomyces sp. CB01881]AUY49080.1 glucose sorbosone dehydrogenase [Streptomyces sp. CB01881]TYC77572.1 PQQ-dependent sugar dehydrogenase [Streptomyces sp. CB01881]
MFRRSAAVSLALLLGPVAAVGCSSVTGPTGVPSNLATFGSSPLPAGSVPASAPVVRATVTDGLQSPWGLVVLPDGDLLVSERDSGRILRVSAKDGTRTEAGTVPGVVAGGEGGLLGLALSPGYPTDHLVYAYLSTEADNRIVRLTYDPAQPATRQLGDPAVLLTGIPRGHRHNGGRIAFGPDGLLYAGTGDSSNPALSQDKGSLGGKILRLSPDGTPAPGNPFPGSPVYSYGHRNVQGLAWDPQGRLWASEFGQDNWDELNLIRPGANYGWPVVEGIGNRPEFTDPVVQWRPSEASPSGIAYADGAVWMAALRGTRLWRVPLDGDRPAAAPQEFLTGAYGRLRTVVADRDGTLLLVTSNTDGAGDPRPGDDRILRVSVP